jgi:AcrR family transcriptional regulator
MDKRIVKTKNSVKTAFMELMFEKDINSITISDIAGKAQINRSTFYLHYKDVYAVLTDIENDVSTKISYCFEQFDANHVYESICNLFNNLTNTLDEMQTVKKFILYSSHSKVILEQLKAMFVDKAMVAFMNTNVDVDREKLYYGLSFIASGIIDAYLEWSYKESKNITLAELSQYIGELAESAINRLVNSEKELLPA